MAGTTLDIKNYITPDSKGSYIAMKFHEWFSLKSGKANEWEELRKYIFATDTSQTSNNNLPWKNKTTLPKLCQIRDNIYAKYMSVMFPSAKGKWLDWHASTKDAAQQEKKASILNYMGWVTSQPQYKEEMSKLVLDYIDYGNCFATVEWIDQRVDEKGLSEPQQGYVGPMVQRISPTNIVFNPVAPSFLQTPKIIRSFVEIGEMKKKLESLSNDENRQAYQDLYDYILRYRMAAMNLGDTGGSGTGSTGSDWIAQDDHYRIEGFTSFRSYLTSGYVEVLTFYGDIFNWETQELETNRVVMVVDRHKIICDKPNPTYFGHPPIFHCGWRVRQDNLWAMGPLDNLVGLQYRIDHEENAQADVLDLITFPVLKEKGWVEDYEWGPMQRIKVSEEGDVEMIAPPFQVLQLDQKMQMRFNLMEELAGAPKEAMGFRTPGEKTAFEVQRQENAADRIFENKTVQFEESFEERIDNALLELARRNIQGPQEINVFDDEFKLQTFMTLTAEDIAGAGQLKPIAARHFAQKAQIVQNLTQLFSSAIGADPDIKAHFSSIKLAKMLEELLDLEDYELVLPYVRLSEQADAQKMMNAAHEQTTMESQTPHGLTPDDHSGPPSTPPLQPGQLEPA